MNSLFRSLATLTLLGALVAGTGWSAAWAQEEEGDASGTVTISEDEPGAETEETPEESATPDPKKMPKPKISDRDPFINPIEAGTFTGGTITKRGGTSAPTVRANPDEAEGTASSEGEGAAVAARAPARGEAEYGDEVEEIDPPAVTITGIVSSGGGRMAILTSPDASHIVRVGDKIGEYRVTAIGERSVNFRISESDFKVLMEDEFGLSSR